MLIGSRAIAHWNKDFKVNPGSDWDIVGYYGQESHFRKYLNIPVEDRIEWHNPSTLNNYSLEKYNYYEVCVPYGLAIIYRSHLWRDYKWDAHITKYFRYILPLLDNTTLHLSDPLLTERIKLTKQAYGHKAPNLNQSNMDFFDDNVVKVYDHDYIHELYAYEDRPMFERLKHEGEEGKAWCAKDLWNELADLQKNQCVAEETQVIATERFLIPNDWQFNSKRAYYMALKKVCTTLCSGWFRDHAIDNFPAIVDMYNPDRFTAVKFKLKG